MTTGAKAGTRFRAFLRKLSPENEPLRGVFPYSAHSAGETLGINAKPRINGMLGYKPSA